MLQLYTGSGSSEIELLKQESADWWERLRRNACCYLIEADKPDVACLLEENHFELWEGTNSFNDPFHLLYLRATPKRYVELERKANDAFDRWAYRVIADTVMKIGAPYIRFIAVDVDFDEIESVRTPKLQITSNVVERAIQDAETLICTSGAVSGLDRIHTVFHGYLKSVCQGANLTLASNDPSVTDLFKLIRKNHPALIHSVNGSAQTDRVLGSMATIVDALNPIRNRSSIAHPNDDLLDEPEALLVINAVRTLLHYLNRRLKL
jgi:Abortive infection C-terminus